MMLLCAYATAIFGIPPQTKVLDSLASHIPRVRVLLKLCHNSPSGVAEKWMGL